MSNLLHRVTQWMSIVISLLGSAWSSSQSEGQRLIDLAEDLEVPGREVGLGYRACVEHGPFLRQVLARRKPRGVVAGVGDLLLCLGAEHDS